MKNLKLLTIAVVLAGLMVMGEKVTASEQVPDRTLMSIEKNDAQFIHNNISMEEKRRARTPGSQTRAKERTGNGRDC